MLSQRLGCEVWVKHENHTPVGAFKVRGGIYYLSQQQQNLQKMLVAATRGNHGQSLAFAAKLFGFRIVIVVPHDNSEEKNAAMQAPAPNLWCTALTFRKPSNAPADLPANGIFWQSLPSIRCWSWG